MILPAGEIMMMKWLKYSAYRGSTT